jgi:hypothetical protein
MVKLIKIWLNRIWCVKVTVIFQKIKIRSYSPIIQLNSPIIQPHLSIIRSFLKNCFGPLRKFE